MKYIKTYEFNFNFFKKKVKEIIQPKNYVRELTTAIYDFLNKVSIDKPTITGDTSRHPRLEKNHLEIHIADKKLLEVDDIDNTKFFIFIKYKYITAQDFDFILNYITNVLEENCIKKQKFRMNNLFTIDITGVKNIIKELEDLENFEFLSSTNKYNL